MIIVSQSNTSVRVPDDLLFYFSQDPLPCPVVGCNWSGQKVGSHCCKVHGIPSVELREIIGANVTQGLCTVAFGEAQSKRAVSQINNFIVTGEKRYPLELCRKGNRHPRRQAGQSLSKALSDIHVKQRMSEAARNSVTPEMRILLSETIKRTWEQMSYLTKTCEECGEDYEVSACHYERSRFCGRRCRNKHNNRKRRKRLDEE